MMPNRPLQAVLPIVTACLFILMTASAHADKKEVIDSNTENALIKLRGHSTATDELLEKAFGVLVFPDVVKMGFGGGGRFGEGSLLVNGETKAYYVTAGVPHSAQPDAEFRAEVILFMTEQALQEFRSSQGWEVGVDGSVSLVDADTVGGVKPADVTEPVVGFMFSDKGLMKNLTMKGSRITRIAR